MLTISESELASLETLLTGSKRALAISQTKLAEASSELTQLRRDLGRQEQELTTLQTELTALSISFDEYASATAQVVQRLTAENARLSRQVGVWRVVALGVGIAGTIGGILAWLLL